MPAYGAALSPERQSSTQATDITLSPLGCVDGLITNPTPDGPDNTACTGTCCTSRDAA